MKPSALLTALFALTMLLSTVAPAAAQEELPQVAIRYIDDSVSDGLAVHWKLDDLSNTTALDFVRQTGENNLALAGAASLSSASIAPLTVPNRAALALNGTADYAVAGTASTARALGGSFTLAAWVRRTTIDTYDAIYDSGNQANEWWVFIAGSAQGNKLGFGERGIAEVYSSVAITDSNWHHIAVVKNGTISNNLSFYVDGNPAGVASVGTVTVPSGPAHLGVLDDGALAAYLAGNLDDVRLYDRILTTADIQRLAQGAGCSTDGAGWATAFRELQCGLDAAVSGDNLWIAGGSYLPGVWPGAVFSLVNGVDLLGGFAGTETNPGQRPAFNPDTPLTVLTGDILGDDLPGTFTNHQENTTNVLRSSTAVGASLERLGVMGAYAGSGLRVLAGAGILNLTDLVFKANNAVEGGGLSTESPLVCNRLYFFDNQAGTGGGLYSGAPIILVGGEFTGNKALEAGGIYAAGSLDLQTVTFLSNIATNSGGAIRGGSGQTIAVSNSLFQNNKSGKDGGAIFANGALQINQSTFMNNEAGSQGGAIQNTGNLYLTTISGSTFTTNRVTGSGCTPVCADGDGGAVAVSGDLSIILSTFTGNEARLDGGAIYASGASALMKDVTFTANKAGYPADSGNPNLGYGGGLYSTAPATIQKQALPSGNTFDSNSAVRGGGAYIAATAAISDTLFTANTAIFGAGLEIAGNGNIFNSRFQSNNAANEGGGLFLTGTANLRDLEVFNNAAQAAGGGMALYLNGLSLIESLMAGFNNMGAIKAQAQTACQGSLSIFNSQFDRNTAAGSLIPVDILLNSQDAGLINNTFIGPQVLKVSTNVNKCTLNARNNIWSGYTAGMQNGSGANQAGVLEDYNILHNAPLGGVIAPGAHTLLVDPMIMANSHYVPTIGSPAIDSGDSNALPPGITTDLCGHPRYVNIFNPAASPPRIDRGACEYNGTVFIAFLPQVHK